MPTVVVNPTIINAYQIKEVIPHTAGGTLIPWDSLAEPIAVTQEYMDNEKPVPGGYYVRLAGGSRKFMMDISNLV